MKMRFARTARASLRPGVICILSLAVSGLLWASTAIGAASSYPTLRLDGPAELVSESNTIGCTDETGRVVRIDHSDTAARAFRDYTGQVHLIAGRDGGPIIRSLLYMKQNDKRIATLEKRLDDLAPSSNMVRDVNFARTAQDKR
ncbi:MAG: hypothetical protein A3G24_03645 [Betaproteobacteria bacterium RIFCSPLOWO2_12_FULL_62_13]|nr:MAG: hypothetical protein A3G24_03645 [Betaproteobacteria bacterium RIFCSPLOWO2_12_FULL_62_13]